jgi:hypothetical protein
MHCAQRRFASGFFHCVRLYALDAAERLHAEHGFVSYPIVSTTASSGTAVRSASAPRRAVFSAIGSPSARLRFFSGAGRGEGCSSELLDTCAADGGGGGTLAPTPVAAREKRERCCDRILRHTRRTRASSYVNLIPNGQPQ